MKYLVIISLVTDLLSSLTLFHCLLLKYILTLCVNTNLWRICDIIKHFLKIKKIKMYEDN